MFSELFSIEWWGQVIAGVAIFLLGISFMGDGLKKLAGNKLKDMINKFTSNTFNGILVGTVVTVLIQSSSATTTLVIGLISAGIMTLKQSIGVIMGANIGTTITAFLIGLDFSAYAPFIMIIGVILYTFISKTKIRSLGQTLLGFGAVFFGLVMMEGCLKPVASMPEFSNLIAEMGKNPLLGLLIGALGTAAIQSSSAFIGVLQALYSTSVEAGVADFTLKMAVPLLIGSNIGTTITSILAALGAKSSAKRAAGIHVIFNLIGAVFFMILLIPFSDLVNGLSTAINISPKMQIAFVHIIFNLLTVVILLPLAKYIVKFIEKIIPKKGVEVIEVDLSCLNKNITNISPITALEIARQQTVIMGNFAVDSLEKLINYFETKDKESKDFVLAIEETIDLFNEKLSAFLAQMEKVKLREEEISMYTVVLKAFRDIERISDHCENLVEFLSECYDRNEEFKGEAHEELKELFSTALRMVKESISIFEKNNKSNCDHIIMLEEELDNMYKKARHKHVERMASNIDDPHLYSTNIFCDIISNIERIGDHCTNIIEDCEFK